MNAVSIRRCTIAELESQPNLMALLDEYGDESRIPEIGEPNPQVATYRVMEKAGFLHPVGAFDGDRLVGIMLPLVLALPHYGVVTATGESFFVPKAERKKGVGLQLLSYVEQMVRGLGAKAMLLSAPTGGTMARVLPRRGYRHSNEVFVKALA